MMLIRLDAKRYASFALTMLAATLLALAAAPDTRSAVYDNFMVGNGVSQNLNPTTNGIMNEVAPITAASSAGSTTLTIGTRRGSTATNGGTLTMPNAVGIGSGRLIMVIQIQGLSAASAPSGGQAPIDLSSTNIGRFELARIQGAVPGNSVNLSAPLKYSYAATGAQIVTVPEWTTVNMAANRVLTAHTWDGSSGGVMAFLANGAVTMAAGSAFDVSATGYRGGTAQGTGVPPTNCSALDGVNGGGKGEGVVPGFWGTGATQRMRGNRASGGGGGDCENAGGGGGGNGGLGGRGGDAYTPDFPEWPVGGMGGQRLSYNPLGRMVIGGGGGGGEQNNNNGGAGGRGGGVLFMRAASMTGTGSFLANGQNGFPSVSTGPSDGAGGGGGGGVIYARFSGSANCTTANALGGNGGLEMSTGNNHGPGGAGGGGRILFQAASGTCAKDSRAGVRGTTVNGSTRGAGPVTQTEVSSVGSTDQPAGALAQPTATVGVPTDSQTVAITSNFSGTATPLARVDVYITGASCNQGGITNLCGSTMADGAGVWTYTTPALPGGAHTVSVTPELLEIAGSATAARNFTVDATPPVAPVITDPGGALLTNDETPTIQGTAEPNSTVHFFDGGNSPANQLPGSATTNGSGNWSFTLPALTPLPATHSITARATDTFGNPVAPVVGNFSTARVISYDNVPTVLEVFTPVEGSFIPTRQPIITGTVDKPLQALTCQIDARTPLACTDGWQVPATEITADGPHSVTVLATDLAGNITTVVRNFTVDTVSPNVAITSPALDCTLISCVDPARPVNSTRPPISFSVTDVNPATSSDCRVDGGLYAACTSPYTPPTLGNGVHTIDVRHIDRAGNVTVASRSVVVDNVLPTVSIDTPANAGFSGASAAMSFTVDDVNPGTSYCQLDGGAEFTCQSGNPLPALSDGIHTLAIRHSDRALNNGPSASVSFTVDTVAPTVTVDWPPEAELLNTTQPQVLFTVGDLNPSPSSLCQLDGGAATPCTSPWVPASPLSQGPHSLVITHTDKAGNVGAAAPRNFTVDSVAPLAPTFDSGPGGALRLTKLQDATIVFTPAEGGGQLQCQLDSNGWSTCTSPQNFTNLTLGEHSLFVRQTDNAGNLGAVGTYTWTIDQTPPPAPNVSGPSGVSSAPSEYFSFYNAEQGVDFECELDGGGWTPCDDTLGYTTGLLADTSHTFSVRSTDPAGNTSSVTTLAWVTDTSGFNVAITESPEVLSNLASSVFRFSATVPTATFTCELDGATPVPCGPDFPFGPLANGDHTFTVYAEQGSEVRDATRSWTIDSTPPSLNVTSPTDGGTSGGTATLNFTASDTGSNGSNGSVSTRCQLDSEVEGPCSNGQTFSNLNSGPHTVAVTTTDLAGNETSDSVSWTVDLAPPSTTLDATPSSAATSNDTRNFTFSADKPSTFECSLDGAAWTSCTSPQQLVVSEGVHTFKVQATANGITEPSPATHTWTYDVTAPNPPIVSGSTLVYSAGSVTFRGTAAQAEDVDVYLTCTTPTTCGSHVPGVPVASGSVAPNTNWDAMFEGVPEGSYTVCVRAVDAAGNTSGCSIAITLVIDNTPPTIAISSPSDSALVNVSTIEFSGSDAASAVSFECEIEDLTTGDPAAFELCSPPNFAPDLTSGHEYRITARATDEIGNSSDDSVTFTFDNVAPTRPTITSPANDLTSNAAPITISGEAESGSTITVYVDGTPRVLTTTAVAGEWTYVFNPDLTERPAAYEIHVVARDAFGNDSQPSLSRNIVVDRTAPAKPVISTPANGSGVNVSRPVISGTAEASSTLELTIDGSPTPVNVPVNGAGNWTYTPSVDLSNGPHLLSAISVDAGGNESVVSDTTGFIVDNQPPVVAISSPANNSYLTNTAVTVNFTATDNDSFNLVCRLNGSIVAPCSAPSYSFSSSQGVQTFQIQATDQGGNVSTAQISFTVDTILPSQPVIQLPSAGSYVTGSSAWVAGTAVAGTGGAVKVRIQLSGPTTADVEADVDGSGNWARNFSGLPDGAYTATVTARDAAGNISSAANRSFSVDNVAPSALTIASPIHGSEITQIQTISGSGVEAGASVMVTVEGSNYPATVTGSTWSVDLFPAYDTTGLAEISVRQTDAAGNAGSSTAVTVRIDKTNPTVSVTSPLQNSTINNPDPNIAFTASDASPTPLVRECRVSTAGQNNTWFSCVTGWQPSTSGLLPLPAGVNSVQVRATDAAGNVTTVTRQFTVDVTPPLTTINNPKPGGVLGRTKDRVTTFNFSSEAGAQFKCSADGAPFTSCSSPHTYTLPQFTDGMHTFAVKATDAAGNEESAPQTHSWILDTLAPNKPFITGPNNGTVTTDNKPQISGTAEMLTTVTVRVNGNVLDTVTTDGSANWLFDFPVSGSGLLAGLPDGTHVLTATAVDSVGNESFPSDPVSITVDANEPVVQIDSSPPAVSNNSNPTFDFSSNEPVKFECRIGSGSWSYCGPFNVFATSGSEPFSLTDGAKQFSVRGADSGGNMSQVVSYSWTIDSVAPNAPVITAPADGLTTTDTTPSVSGTAEPNSTVRIYLNGSGTADTTTTANGSGVWSTDLSSRTDGTYNIRAAATDAASNTGALSAPRQVIVDTTPPGNLSVVQQAGSGLAGAKPIFLFDSDDSLATMTCSIDGGAATSCFSPHTPTQALSVGQHTLTVVFSDPVGNASAPFTLPFTATEAQGGPPTPPPAEDPGQCFPKGITITDLNAKGKKVTLTGFAKSTYIGQTVTAQYRPAPKKVAGKGVVQPDGSFKITIKAPAKKLWSSKKTAYRVQAGAPGSYVTTGWTQLTRRMASTSIVWKNGKIDVTGAVTKPLYPKTKALVEARVGCNGAWKQIGSAKISSSGKFSAKLAYDPTPTTVFVRVKAVVGSRPKKPRKINTGSFVIPVVIK